MARIYKSSNEYGTHWYEAISDTPISNEHGDNRGYPKARMAVVTTQSSAEPNWNFKEIPKTPSERVRDVNKRIGKETGVPDIASVNHGRMRELTNLAYSNAEHIEALKDADRRIKSNVYISPVNQGYLNENRAARRDSGINYAKSIRSINNLSSQLFDVQPQKAEVVSAFTHSKMRHMIPLMGALAYQEHGELTASSDLSRHSSRLTKHAQEKGLPVQTHRDNKEARITNGYYFDDNNMISWTGKPDTITSVEVPNGIRSAKMAYKALRGIQSAKASSPQFEQLRLPGMES